MSARPGSLAAAQDVIRRVAEAGCYDYWEGDGCCYEHEGWTLEGDFCASCVAVTYLAGRWIQAADGTGVGRLGRYAGPLLKLRSTPGEWAVVATYKPYASGGYMAAKRLQERGYEADARMEDGELRVYARWPEVVR